jgi:predicted  nucleic acid-binding Zn-ribbon protein
MTGPNLISEKADLTALINSHIDLIDRLKKERSQLKEMLDDFFRNDSTFQIHDTATKEASKIRTQTKKQILKQPQAADLAGRIQSLASQIKEHNTELSGYLQDYSRTSGTNSFETPDGEVRQIIYIARLTKIGK